MPLNLIQVKFPGLKHSQWGYDATCYRRENNAKGCNVATFWLIDNKRNWWTETEMSFKGQHSERRCWDNVKAECIKGLLKIFAVYTEREPCGKDNANCAGLLAQVLTKFGVNGIKTPIYYVTKWPDSNDFKTALIVNSNAKKIASYTHTNFKALAKIKRRKGTNYIRRMHTVVGGKLPYFGPAFGKPNSGKT